MRAAFTAGPALRQPPAASAAATPATATKPHCAGWPESCSVNLDHCLTHRCC